MDSRLLVVGLAPGVKGANRTGRPFTGDFAGVLLYETLIKFGFAEGRYAAAPDDGLVLRDCRVTNAVRCVPPANLPKPAEIAACNLFLRDEIAAMPKLQTILALGGIAHRAVLQACALRGSHVPFMHGRQHELPSGLRLADSYHVSRLNTNTGRLTTPMFESVVADIRNSLA
jgi:uracil-DNA glycosylase